MGLFVCRHDAHAAATTTTTTTAAAAASTTPTTPPPTTTTATTTAAAAASSATASAGLPHGAGHAAQHAGHGGDELRGADAPRRDAHAGMNGLSYDCSRADLPR